MQPAEQGKKTAEEILLERARLEMEASRALRIPIEFGMDRENVKKIKAAAKAMESPTTQQ